MEKLTKFLTVMLLFFLVLSCGNTGWLCRKKTEQTYSQSPQMVSIYNMGITNAQLDSICIADTLSMDFNDWLNGYFIDFETRDTIFKHTFIKTIKGKQEAIYVVTEWKDSLAIMKRVKK